VKSERKVTTAVVDGLKDHFLATYVVEKPRMLPVDGESSRWRWNGFFFLFCGLPLSPSPLAFP
jgi:hypothetical protein